MVNRTEYSYKDEHGAMLFKKVRIEPGRDGKSKSFHYEREENGRTVTNGDGRRKVLYRLPDIIHAASTGQPIFLVEGEKDADNLVHAGLTASTAPVTINWHQEYTDSLEGTDVVLLYDNDKTGLQRRDLIINNLMARLKAFA